MCGLGFNFSPMKCEQKSCLPLKDLAQTMTLCPHSSVFFHLLLSRYRALQSPTQWQSHKMEKSKSLNDHVEQNHLIHLNTCPGLLSKQKNRILTVWIIIYLSLFVPLAFLVWFHYYKNQNKCAVSSTTKRQVIRKQNRLERWRTLLHRGRTFCTAIVCRTWRVNLILTESIALKERIGKSQNIRVY